MLSDHTLRWIAPNSFMEWLRQRALVHDLRSLLQRLRLATPCNKDVHTTMQTVINEIASAEEVERQAFRSILEIEAAYEGSEKRQDFAPHYAATGRLGLPQTTRRAR